MTDGTLGWGARRVDRGSVAPPSSTEPTGRREAPRTPTTQSTGRREAPASPPTGRREAPAEPTGRREAPRTPAPPATGRREAPAEPIGRREAPPSSGRHQAPPAQRRAPFRPDIEGMRAVAVLLVLGFHAGLPLFTGGFIGVDVFFVISGFLMATLMLAEVSTSGAVDVAAFYARRVLRIVPSVALVVVVTGVGAWLLLPPLSARDTAGDMIASALFVANWHFIAQGSDYFATSIDHSPLLHLWSLGVEEQFYLVWPFAVLLALILVRHDRGRAARSIGVVVLVVSAVSLVLSLLMTPVDETSAYLGTATRAWQFGAGALLAVAAPTIGDALRRTPEMRLLLGWAGLGALVLSTVFLSDATPYPGSAALVPIGAAVAIIAVGGDGAERQTWSVPGLLARPTMRAIGRLSFAWYLWHWPVLVLAEAWAGPDAPSWLPVVAVAASALPAYLSLRFVERPLRSLGRSAHRGRAAVLVGTASTAVAVVAALLVSSAATAELERQAQLVASAPAPKQVDVPRAGASTTPTPQRTGGAVTPAPLTAVDDVPQPIDCQISDYGLTGPPCRFGPADGPSVFLFGDSHAQQWQSPLIRIARQRGWSLTVLTKSGCPVAAIPSDGSGTRFARADCAQWREQSVRRMVRERPALVIVASREGYVDDLAVRTAAWARTLADLAPSGARIVQIADTPWAGQRIPDCISGSIDDWQACAFAASDAVLPDPIVALQAEGRATGVRRVDLTDLFCPDGTCQPVIDGILVYRDESHLTDTFARSLTRLLGRSLAATGALPTRAPSGG